VALLPPEQETPAKAAVRRQRGIDAMAHCQGPRSSVQVPEPTQNASKTAQRSGWSIPVHHHDQAREAERQQAPGAADLGLDWAQA
jgi:hypothetical protein